MVRHVSAVLMHHNLCKQQRLKYIYTNGDSILSMVEINLEFQGFSTHGLGAASTLP